jgi:N-acetyl-gamma-glutamyl-phosphate reductase
MQDPKNIAVVGVSGYTGFELAKLLLAHPEVRALAFYLRDPRGARCLTELFPALRGRAQAPVRPLSIEAIAASGAGTAFLALPHEASAEIAPRLLEAGLRVVDLSGAFRFRDPAVFERWYRLGTPHAAWLPEAVYGLPEFYAERIREARLVANPGCYATSAILALRPLAEAGWIAPGSAVVCDAKSGATGAGKEPRRDLQFSELDENFKAYNLFSHRHTPEITEHTGLPESRVVFSAHLLPVARGILSTLYVSFDEPKTPEAVEALFRRTYAGRPMVRVWKAGSLPELQHVAHTQFADLGFALDASGRRMVMVSCLDNLGKGAAGQAVQNFNHLVGIEEQTGLL